MRALAAAVVAAGCTLPWAQQPGAPPSAPVANASLDEADAALAAGKTRTAAALYERVAREQSGHDAGARALHELLVLRTDPKSPMQDHKAAAILATRLANDYRDTRWVREARAWRVLLRSIDRCEAEATQLGADAERLRQTLDSLKDTDVELEQHP
jgi:hypothetical protein